MKLPEAYETAAMLEQHLGDPLDPGARISFARAVELDEQELYPEDAVRCLDEFGLHRFYVPRPLSGALDTYEEVFALLRTVARRDFTAAVTHGMTLAAASIVWIAGDDGQRRRLADRLLAGQQVSIALHEKAHGSDLVACEVSATRSEGDFIVSGEKWVVGNVCRSAAVVLYARTRIEGGPRGFSFLLVNKDALPEATFSYLPKFKSHGVRGHELAGMVFDRAPIPSADLVGREGFALEIALKCSQVTRVLALAPSLGAADTALRCAVAHATDRKLYGDTVWSIPAAQRTLVDAFLDLLLVDCVCLASVRAIEAAPGRCSVWAAFAKSFVTTTVECIVHDLSTILGSRFYLRDVHWFGIFQKIVRDLPLARIGHYGTAISSSHLAAQLPMLHGRIDLAASVDSLEQSLAPIFALDTRLSPLDAGRLDLVTRSDEMLQGFRLAEVLLERVERTSSGDREVLQEIRRFSRALSSEADLVKQFFSALPKDSGPAQSPELFDAAKRYSTIRASLVSILSFAFNRTKLDLFFARGEWLVALLDRQMRILHPTLDPLPNRARAGVRDELLRRYREKIMFSMIPLPIG